MQTNTRILAHEFEYLSPNRLDEALGLLDKYHKNVKILAGGTDLLVKMKTVNLKPDYLINIKNIQELNFITYKEDEGLKIGGAICLSQVERSEEVKEKYPALYEAVQSMAAIAVKNMGTVAGNLCNASPAADTAPPLIVYGAKVKLLSNRGERVVPVEEFFTGVGKTVISSDELLTQIDIPSLDKNTGSSFLKMGRVKADISKINLAVCLKREDNLCKDCKIAFGSVAEKPIRVKGAENILIKQPFTSNLLGEVAEKAAEEIRPITDVRSTVEYRYEIAKVITKEAIKLAWERAGGKI